MFHPFFLTDGVTGRCEIWEQEEALTGAWGVARAVVPSHRRVPGPGRSSGPPPSAPLTAALLLTRAVWTHSLGMWSRPPGSDNLCEWVRA